MKPVAEEILASPVIPASSAKDLPMNLYPLTTSPPFPPPAHVAFSGGPPRLVVVNQWPYPAILVFPLLI